MQLIWNDAIVLQPAQVVVPAVQVVPAAQVRPALQLRAAKVQPRAGALGRVLQKALQGEPLAANPDEKADPNKKVDPQILAIENQLRAQFDMALNSQLYLVRSVASPTYEQQVELLKAGKAALKISLHNYALRQKNQQQNRPQNIQQFMGRNPAVAASDPQAAMESAVAKAAEKILNEQQLAALEQDAAQREVFRRQTTIDNLVGLIDKRLLLSAEQRERLAKNLLKNWQENWVGHAAMLMHGNEYLPTIPNDAILPVLNKRQKLIWKRIPQQGNMVFGNVGLLNNVVRLPSFKPEKAAQREKAGKR